MLRKTLRAKLSRAWLQKMLFRPGIWGFLLNPFYLARRALYRVMEELAPELDGAILDVGCGTKPYQHLYTRQQSYLGLEVGSPQANHYSAADVYYSGGSLPFADCQFDSVVSNQVLEHVFTPEIFLAEIRRVLKPGGKFLVTVPFVWDEHEQPHDFARYSSFGLKALLERNGFTLLTARKLNADAAIFLQLAAAYWHKVTLRLPGPLRVLVLQTLVPVLNGLGLLARAVLPANPDLYLDNVVLARKNEA